MTTGVRRVHLGLDLGGEPRRGLAEHDAVRVRAERAAEGPVARHAEPSWHGGGGGRVDDAEGM